MADLFPELVADVHGLPDPMPARPDMWIVLACYELEDWRQPSATGWYLRREAAEAAATKLAACWRHRRVVRIPGEATNGKHHD